MRSERCVATLNRHFQKRTLSGNKVRGRPGRSSSSPSSESTLEGPRRPEKLGKATWTSQVRDTPPPVAPRLGESRGPSTHPKELSSGDEDRPSSRVLLPWAPGHPSMPGMLGCIG